MAAESRDPFQSEPDQLSESSILGRPETRRRFMKQVAGTSVAIAIGPNVLTSSSVGQPVPSDTTIATSE